MKGGRWWGSRWWGGRWWNRSASVASAYPSPLESYFADLAIANFFTVRQLLSEEVTYDPATGGPRIILAVFAERAGQFVEGDRMSYQRREALLHVSSEDVTAPAMGDRFLIRGTGWSLESVERRVAGMLVLNLRRAEPHERYGTRVRALEG